MSKYVWYDKLMPFSYGHTDQSSHVTSPQFVTFPQQFAGTHLSWVERGTVRVECLAQEHNTVSPARARTRIARSNWPPTCFLWVCYQWNLSTKHLQISFLSDVTVPLKVHVRSIHFSAATVDFHVDICPIHSTPHLECGYRAITRPATTTTATASKSDSLLCFSKYVCI